MKKFKQFFVPNRMDFFWVLVLGLFATLTVSGLLLRFKPHYGFFNCTKSLSYYSAGILLGITGNLAWGRINFRKSFSFLGLIIGGWILILMIKPYEIAFLGTGPTERWYWPENIFHLCHFDHTHIEPWMIPIVLMTNALFFFGVGLLIFTLRWISTKPRWLALPATAIIAFIFGFKIYDSHQLSLFLGYATVENAWQALRDVIASAALFVAFFFFSGANCKFTKWWMRLLIWIAFAVAIVLVAQHLASTNAIVALGSVSIVTMLGLTATLAGDSIANVSEAESQHSQFRWPSIASFLCGAGYLAIITMLVIDIYKTRDESHAPASTWRDKKTTIRVPENFSSGHRKRTGAFYDYSAGEFGAHFNFRDLSDVFESPAILCTCQLSEDSDPNALQFVVDNYRENLCLDVRNASPRFNTALMRELDKKTLVASSSEFTAQQLSDLMNKVHDNIQLLNVNLLDDGKPVNPAVFTAESINYCASSGTGHLPALFKAIGSISNLDVGVSGEIDLDDWKAALDASEKYSVRVESKLPEGAKLSDIQPRHKLIYQDPDDGNGN